jgi:hypothetical protein
LRSRPSLQFTCGIFVTLGKCFRPITLLGDFPVRMSQLEHVGGRAHGCRDDSIDCDSGVRCRFFAGPLGRQARPLRRCEIEEGTVSDFASAPNQACCLVGHDAPLARVRRGKSPAAGFLSPGGRGVVVLLAMTRPANPRYGKSRPVDSTAAGRGAYAIRALRGYEPAAGLLCCLCSWPSLGSGDTNRIRNASVPMTRALRCAGGERRASRIGTSIRLA